MAAAFRLDRADWRTFVDECVILGGAGIPFSPGDLVRFDFDAVALSVRHKPGLAEGLSVPWRDVTGLSVEGPGKTTHGPVFFGGGFGVRGALTGIAIASLLSALTRTTQVTTILHVELRNGEIYAYNGQTEPFPLRVSLSPAFVALRTARST